MGKILLSLILSIDGLGIGASFGIAGTKITKRCYMAVFGITFLALELSILAGEALAEIIPEKFTVFTGSGILVILGIYLVLKKINEKRTSLREGINSSERGMNTFELSKMCDMDNSGSIDMLEGVFLAAALSADSFGAGIGLSAIYDDLGILPVLMAVFQAGLLCAGYAAGSKLGAGKGVCLWKDFIPAGVLIAIGIAGIKTCGKLI